MGGGFRVNPEVQGWWSGGVEDRVEWGKMGDGGVRDNPVVQGWWSVEVEDREKWGGDRWAGGVVW